MSKIRIVIAEKSYIIRTGLEKIIEDFFNMRVVHHEENPDNIGKVISEFKPHIVIINMKLLDELAPDFIKTSYRDSAPLFIALAGTNRSIPEDNHFDAIINIDQDKALVVDTLNKLIEENELGSDSNSNNDLSERERSVVREIGLGSTNKEMAEKLFISVHTVVTHRKNITRKLGIKSVSGLTVYALLNKIITTDEVEN